MTRKQSVPMTKQEANGLQAGEKLLLSGVMYTARDTAHKRMIESLEKNEELPVSLQDICIYYAGPAPNKPGQVIGSCGPTTSGRMDAYAPLLLQKGQTVMIGKGLRNESVIEAMKIHGGVYLTAVGGAGALLSKCIKKMECIAYEELGPEAIYKLEVIDFPVVVTIDSQGNNLYHSEPFKYRKSE